MTQESASDGICDKRDTWHKKGEGYYFFSISKCNFIAFAKGIVSSKELT